MMHSRCQRLSILVISISKDVNALIASADALHVLHQPQAEAKDDTEALARLLAFLAVAASQRLGLSGALALAYGDAVAYLATGSSVGLGTDFERGMAHRLCWSDGRPWPCVGAPGDEDSWERARPGLRQLYEQFQTWQENPDLYAATREKWYRALALEMEMPKEM
jgi:hypothetical protein